MLTLMSPTNETLLERLPRILHTIRTIIDPMVFAPPPADLESISSLLGSVPLAMCSELCTTWEAVQICHTPEELDDVVSAEDRMVIEMVQALYDHNRCSIVKRDTIHDHHNHPTERNDGIS
jgi:hypothetical protein